MRKLLLSILMVLVLASTGWAASYYGCATAAINADSTFCTTATGSCTGDTAVTAATALAGTHTLFANGCTITIPNNADVTITAAKLSNKDDGGDMVDGGQFTYATSASYVAVVNANLETGGTTGTVLSVTGSAAGAARLTVNATTITAGSATNMFGLGLAHTVGTIVVNATTVTAGTSTGTHGLYINAGPVTFTGNATGGSSTGAGLFIAGASATTMAGDCTGGSAYSSDGCYAVAGTFTLTGNIINTATSSGVRGVVRWTPTAPSSGVTGHYIKFDGGGTAVYAGKNTDDATKALTTFYYIDPTDGTSDQGSASTTGGGGGAWGF